jgi:hypothetical protein
MPEMPGAASITRVGDVSIIERHTLSACLLP